MYSESPIVHLPEIGLAYKHCAILDALPLRATISEQACDLSSILEAVPLSSGDYPIMISVEARIWLRLQLKVRLLYEKPELTGLVLNAQANDEGSLIVTGVNLDHSGLVLLVDGVETNYELESSGKIAVANQFSDYSRISTLQLASRNEVSRSLIYFSEVHLNHAAHSTVLQFYVSELRRPDGCGSGDVCTVNEQQTRRTRDTLM